MDGCTTLNNQICKTCQNWFCPSWRCLRCMMAFVGPELSQQSKTWMKTVLTCFIYKNYCWAAIPDPIWTTNKRKINMLSGSSTENNFMFFLFDFERFRMNLGFLFLTHTIQGGPERMQQPWLLISWTSSMKQLFFILFGRTFIFQQNYTMIISFE